MKLPSKPAQTIGIIAIVVALLTLPGTRLLDAAPGEDPLAPGEWSTPINLSNTPSDSVWPRIAADSMGNVHVVWVELEEPNSQRMDGPTIYYTMWNGSVWSQPIDVIANPPGGYAHLPSICVDGYGSIHLLWHNWQEMYHSSANVLGQPWSARSWSRPQPTTDWPVSPYWSNVVARDSNLYLVWESGDIWFQRSQDGGMTWTEPERVAETPLISHRPRLIVDDQGILHVVWDDTDENDNGYVIWYARSADDGETWSSAALYDRRQSVQQSAAWWANIIAANDVLLVAWIERFALISTYSLDGGNTWSRPVPFFSSADDPTGRKSGWGYVELLADGQGDVYGIGAMQASVVWSRWSGPTVGWSPVSVVAADQGSRWGQRVRAAITRGNRLHAVWMNERDGNIEIYYSTMQLPVAEVSPEPFWPTNTPTPLPTRVTITPLPSATPLPTAFPWGKDDIGPAPTTASSGAVLIPVAVVSILLLGVIVVRQLTRR